MAWMRSMEATIYEQFIFCEKHAIHRSSPLVNSLRVVDRADAYKDGKLVKVVNADKILEEGRIVPLRFVYHRPYLVIDCALLKLC